MDINKTVTAKLVASHRGHLGGIDLYYEKIPITYFLCGIVGHMEEHCVHFEGKNEDDLSKLYGQWFQFDVLDENYRKPKGKRFGLDAAHGWSMKAHVHMDEEIDEGGSTYNNPNPCQGVVGTMSEVESSQVSKGTHVGMQVEDNIIGASNLSDLNDIVDPKELLVDSMAIIPFQQNHTNQKARGLTLFSFDLNVVPPSCKENLHIPSIGDSGSGSYIVGMKDVGFTGSRGGEELGLGQQMGKEDHGVNLLLGQYMGKED